MTHTPGPWESFGPLKFTTYGGDPKRRIAVIDYTQGNPSEESDANARLIAAAPDLLAALIEIKRQTDESRDFRAAAECAYIAHAAISKATGTSP